MNHQSINDRIDRAIKRATEHVGGQREACLPPYLDPQVERFLETLRLMKAILQSSTEASEPSQYMSRAIADGWPFESEMGRLICEAETAFHSRGSNET